MAGDKLRLVFWNVARTRGSEGTRAADLLMLDLAGLAEEHRPDVIVLCECLKDYMEQASQLPPGWRFHRPNEAYMSYFGDTTLRYALLAREGTPCDGFLLETTRNAHERSFLRPALAVRSAGDRSFVALHARSSTRQDRAKLNQLEVAAEEFQEHLGGSSGDTPDLFIGDFNINLAAVGVAHVDALVQREYPILRPYKVRPPDQGTHRADGDFDSKLDWALTRGRQRVRTLVPSPRPEPDPRRQLRVVFEGQKNSDHRPILIEW